MAAPSSKTSAAMPGNTKEFSDKKTIVRECHEICDACHNCLRGQKGKCRWDSERRAMIVTVGEADP
ncbi:hypothetical protein TALC_00363 [Thermoplasmatales archaeon BRNA1]|nr:hypothetical protein TALC_00363 [Thermoplasmatales archaeon BRNA1]